MKIAIMATGGLGGYYGALLAKDGHDVIFIARGAHLHAIRERGLTIKSIHGDLGIHPARATHNPAEVGAVDWIIFGVKTYDTTSAAQLMQPMIGANTTVVNFQNGVDSHEEIAAIVGKEHVIVAPTQIVSNITAPGLIEQKSPFRSSVIGEVYGRGLSPRVQEFAAMLKHTGVDASAVADGRIPLWHKLIFIASIAGLASISRTEPFTLFQLPEARETLRAAMDEVKQVGLAQGVTLDPDIVDRHYQNALNLRAGSKPSMLLDLEQGKRLEIDTLSGTVVRLGKAKNIATPVHQTIYVALKPEDKRRKTKM